MVDSKDNFRQAVERVIWAHSNVSTEERAEVLREYVDGLEGDESRFDDKEEHIRVRLREMGYRLPEEGGE